MSRHNPDILNTSGIHLNKDAFVVIVRTEWNADIIDVLEKGCTEILEQHNISFKVITVPGAFEIPFAIKNYWDNHQYKVGQPAAFIALGCIIKGDTPHFKYVCKAVTAGIAKLNLLLSVPTIFGVLTVNKKYQAEERTGGKHGHKGKEAAVAAIKMIAMSESLRQQ